MSLARATKLKTKYEDINQSVDFVSSVLNDFKNLTGTQSSTIANILIYNVDCVTEYDYINIIKLAFSYSGVKSSADYRSMIYGEVGYSKWLSNVNKSRQKAKSDSLCDESYIRKSYVSTIMGKLTTNHSEDLVYGVVKEFLPISDDVRKLIVSVLNIGRFTTIDEYVDNLKKLINFPGVHNSQSKEYGSLLYGSDGYRTLRETSATKQINTKSKLYTEYNGSDDHILNVSRKILSKLKIEVELDFISNIVKNSDFELDNSMHFNWLCDQLNFMGEDSIELNITNFNNIVNYSGNRHHGFEWNLLRYGFEEANRRSKAKSLKFSGKLNYFYNHDGKFSIWSDKYKGEIDDIKRDEIKRQLSINQTNNPNNVFSRAHYKTDEEYREFQRKDLKFYINKYGEDVGKDVYNKKRMIWNYSRCGFNELDLKESIKLYGNDPCTIYVLDLQNGTFKVGITTTTINKRYQSVKHKFDVIFSKTGTLHNFLECELIIKNIMYKYTISDADSIDGFGVTETYYNSCLEEVLDLIRINTK